MTESILGALLAASANAPTVRVAGKTLSQLVTKSLKIASSTSRHLERLVEFFGDDIDERSHALIIGLH